MEDSHMASSPSSTCSLLLEDADACCCMIWQCELWNCLQYYPLPLQGNQIKE